MTTMLAALNHELGPSALQGMSNAWQRTLARLGDYTRTIVQALNLRPTAAAVHTQNEHHLLVRLTVPHEHLMLRIAPESDLGGYVYFLRNLGLQHIPAARLIHRDLTRSTVPFAYVVESYVPGQTAERLSEGAQRHAARQAGRLLRRIHRVNTPSAGRPNELGRWPQQAWAQVLRGIARSRRLEPTDSILFSEEDRGLLARICALEQLQQLPIGLIHGDFGPQAVQCTGAGNVHLEAVIGSGDTIGGDAMFDLAQGLRPSHGSAWCEGLVEGYLTGGQFSDDERRRLNLYQPLVNSWSACRLYQRGLPHEADLLAAREQIAALRSSPWFEAVPAVTGA